MPIDSMLFKKKQQQEMQPDSGNESVTSADIGGVPAPAAPSTDSKGEKSGDEFQLQLDRLDQLIQSENGINSFNMDYVRGYVRLIMTDLRNQVDLDALLIDRDVHNILHFIRTVKDSAVQEKTQKKEKAAAKSQKKARFKINFGDLPSDLSDLSNLKV